MKVFQIFILLFLLLTSCGKNQQQSDASNEIQESKQKENSKAKTEPESNYSPQSTDLQTAANIKNFLVNAYLKDDLKFLQKNDRRFQFFKVDLNNDGKEEIFVRFMGPFFCGTGGCTFLLLDKYGEIITRFTVTRAPVFVEKTAVNGWSVLLVKDSGVFKELVFEGKSYPSNPSVLNKAPYDAPSGHATVMFDDKNFPCQTFEF